MSTTWTTISCVLVNDDEVKDNLSHSASLDHAALRIGSVSISFGHSDTNVNERISMLKRIRDEIDSMIVDIEVGVRIAAQGYTLADDPQS